MVSRDHIGTYKIEPCLPIVAIKCRMRESGPLTCHVICFPCCPELTETPNNLIEVISTKSLLHIVPALITRLREKCIYGLASKRHWSPPDLNNSRTFGTGIYIELANHRYDGRLGWFCEVHPLVSQDHSRQLTILYFIRPQPPIRNQVSLGKGVLVPFPRLFANKFGVVPSLWCCGRGTVDAKSLPLWSHVRIRSQQYTTRQKSPNNNSQEP